MIMIITFQSQGMDFICSYLIEENITFYDLKDFVYMYPDTLLSLTKEPTSRFLPAAIIIYVLCVLFAYHLKLYKFFNVNFL